MARLFDIEILGNRQAVAQGQFLMHDPNTERARALGREKAEINRPAIDSQCARVWYRDAGQNAHECALAGSIGADETDNVPGRDGE
jgi:hypothetical protein